MSVTWCDRRQGKAMIRHIWRLMSWSVYVNSTMIVFAIRRSSFGQFGKIHPRRTVWHWLIREKSQPDLFSFFSFSLLFSFLFLPFPFITRRLSLPCLQLHFNNVQLQIKNKNDQLRSPTYMSLHNLYQPAQLWASGLIGPLWLCQIWIKWILFLFELVPVLNSSNWNDLQF